MAREARYTVPIRTRLDMATAAALNEAAAARGAELGSIVRLLVEVGLGRLDKISPVHRRRAPVTDPQAFAAAVRDLGSIAGNLQRLYVFARDERQLDIPELLQAKDEVRRTSAALRAVLGQGEDA